MIWGVNMQGQFLYIATFIILVALFIFMINSVIRKKRVSKYRDILDNLEREKNLIASTPVLSELSKVEPIIKNEKMEEKFNRWQDRFEEIKKVNLAKIDDMIVDLDTYFEKKDYQTCRYRIAKTELEIYKAREKANHLIEEIKEITLSEEKYRNIVTKLKTKYRKENKEYQDHKDLYDDMQEAIALQLENIERRFLDFEHAMEQNEYNEVVHIVKALDTMIDHMGIIIEEVPDVLLMAKQLIPKRMREVESTYQEMVKEGYPLEYLNLEYNIKESTNNINTILDKVKVLNLEDCMFELKTILDYLDSLFVDFEKERLSRKVYEEINRDFSSKLEKVNKLVSDVYNQLESIKNTYDLNDEDLEIIKEVNKTLVVINDDYQNLEKRVQANSTPYSMLHKEIEDLTVRLKEMEESFDVALKSLGNMYDDEERAREQLVEIESFLKQCKLKIRSYKLPIITDEYFVQLAEANEAIGEVIKELEKKPIVIKTLNTRVDTARDLVLKLYNTTNEMIKTAQMAEIIIVYGNRYRDTYTEVDAGLQQAEKEFFKGNYKKSLDTSIKTTKLVDENIYKKLLAVYDD